MALNTFYSIKPFNSIFNTNKVLKIEYHKRAKHQEKKNTMEQLLKSIEKKQSHIKVQILTNLPKITYVEFVEYLKTKTESKVFIATDLYNLFKLYCEEREIICPSSTIFGKEICQILPKKKTHYGSSYQINE
jgi:hypothetical protein